MTRTWFRSFARKFRSGQKLFANPRSTRRSCILPRVETLEDRTVTSTMIMEPPAVLTVFNAQSGQFAVSFRSSDIALVATQFANLTGSNAQALQNILEDIRNLDTAIASGQSLPLVLSYGDQATPKQADPGSFEIVVSVDKRDSTVGQPSSADRVVRLERVIAQPGVDPTIVQAAESSQGHASQASSAANPEITVLRTEQVPNATNAAGLAHPASYPANQSPPGPSVPSQSDPQSLDFAPAESNGIRPLGQETTNGIQARAEVVRAVADLPDGMLLERDVVHREQEAFTTLVNRYERFVLDVCQNVLGDSHAAQDAFQATFLVLARKANLIDGQNPIAAWLYRVAYHVALRLRAVAARQRRREKDAVSDHPIEDPGNGSEALEKQELCQALSEELQRLPEKHRVPLVLCYFDGLTHEEAAQAIGLPRGSMAKRIGEGLERLRERLLERGFIP